MSFIRPEVETFLRSYGEVFAGILLAAFGLYFVMQTGWVLQGLGGVLIFTGITIAYTAYRRARFPHASDGPGVVEVDERQISYFAAFAGGTVSIEALARISIVTQDAGPMGYDTVWHFEEDGGGALHVPASASGIERLFDAFAPLNGVDYEVISEASRSSANKVYTVWSKDRAQLH